MLQLLAHLWGDYLLQSEWMAQNKTKRNWPCLVHCALYSALFIPLCWKPGWVSVSQPAGVYAWSNTPPTTPVWFSTWLLIIADNTLHLTINYLALRYL
jgi:hypothetical protein